MCIRDRDKALDHPGPEHTLRQISRSEEFAAGLAVDQFGDVGKGRIGLRKAAHHLLRHCALADARGVLEAAEDQEAAALVIIDIGLLPIVVARRFLCLLYTSTPLR